MAQSPIHIETPTKDFQKITAYAIGAACCVYVAGWFIDVMEVDAAQYAAMTVEMLEKGDYLHFTDRGRNYLDKPPLLFWVSGLSMSVFGNNNIAYRLPAFIATLLALYSTFRLGALYYDKRTGLLAACILATTQAVFLMNHDVRTDTNLMCWFIFSLWQLAAFLEERRPLNFVLGFMGVALAMLSKGPIGLVAPGLAIGGHLALKADWKNIFHPRWILGAAIVAIGLLPMAYGLYTQFDLHPEAVTNGQTGVSGLRFFFWTQSFGRITGESIWSNDAGAFFLTHTTLWAFAPWSILLIPALFQEIKLTYYHFAKGPAHKEKREFLCLAGFLLPFIALSSSNYQLPHYAFIVYPLGAIITASYVIRQFYQGTNSTAKTLYGVQSVLMIVVLIFVFLVMWVSFPEQRFAAFIPFAVGLFALGWFHFKGAAQHKLILVTLATAIALNVTLNVLFYPQLLHYQDGSEVGLMARRSGLTENSLYSYQAETPYSMDFYAGTSVRPENDFDSLINKRNIWIFLKDTDVADFMEKRPDAKVIHTMGSYPVSQLTAEFLNPASRDKTLQKRCLIKL